MTNPVSTNIMHIKVYRIYVVWLIYVSFCFLYPPCVWLVDSGGGHPKVIVAYNVENIMCIKSEMCMHVQNSKAYKKTKFPSQNLFISTPNSVSHVSFG